jgi:hypothetical protein
MPIGGGGHQFLGCSAPCRPGSHTSTMFVWSEDPQLVAQEMPTRIGEKSSTTPLLTSWSPHSTTILVGLV